jgi:hypothetical protein
MREVRRRVFATRLKLLEAFCGRLADGDDLNPHDIQAA